jgi:hypothetical protein
MAEPTTTEIMAAISDLGTRMDKRFDAIERDISEFEIEVRTRLDGIDKRLDDQNAILAALIPAKIAAVGR